MAVEEVKPEPLTFTPPRMVPEVPKKQEPPAPPPADTVRPNPEPVPAANTPPVPAETPVSAPVAGKPTIPAGWSEYTSKEFGFKTYFPGTPLALSDTCPGEMKAVKRNCFASHNTEQKCSANLYVFNLADGKGRRSRCSSSTAANCSRG